jgi:hypothetical protein
MVADPLATSIPDIARWLEEKRDTGQSVILFTGARTGGLFRSKPLYSTVQYFSPRTFENMSRVAQFGECSRILDQEDFSKSDIDTILIASTQGLEVSEADLALAELAKLGIFRTIISTNIDDLLTNALLKRGMHEKHDFLVYIPQEGLPEDILQPQPNHLCQVLKVFGDLKLDKYNLIRQDLYLNTHEKLKDLLTTLLQNNVLMLGYDPHWDKPIDIVLPQQGQELWYVNEGQVEPSILRALRKRNGRYLSGKEGYYEDFIRALYRHLMGEKSFDDYFGKPQRTSLSSSTNPSLPSPLRSEQPQTAFKSLPNREQENPPILSPQEREQRRKVLIAYSQQDRRYLSEFKTHLARYERERLLNIWDDTKIGAGKIWRDELREALDITRVAILLISADFLASSFIEENILPQLLRAAEAGGALILPVILSHCVFEDTSLQQFQPFNNPSEPLADKRPNVRHKTWADLVRYIITLTRR